jgi:HK97 gp10 family phage protein
MGAKITVNTIEEGLKKEVQKFPRIQSKALKEGANSLKPILFKNTPLSSETRHARNNIAISNIRTDKDTFDKYAVIGFPKGYSHRIHTTEFGTMYQRPQLFITKTEKEGREDANDAIVAAMRRGMKY